MISSKQTSLLWMLTVGLTLGCGTSGDTVLNTRQMTPEEIAAMVAQDQSVDDEESKGASAKLNKSRRK